MNTFYSTRQIDLFQTVQKAYVSGSLANADLYEHIVQKGVLKTEQLAICDIQDKTGRKYCSAKREVRWIQQTLKKLGLLENAGKRGEWRLTARGRRGVTPAQPRQVLLGFSTALGIALWGSCSDVFSKLDEPVSLCLTSPPYPLARARAYGNPDEAQFVDWICTMLEPIVKSLMPGGSVVLNVSNDIFLKGSPARSLYRERMVLALHGRLGLFKMDELVWHNPCKPPGPMQWASKERFQLNVAWEPVYWCTGSPTIPPRCALTTSGCWSRTPKNMRPPSPPADRSRNASIAMALTESSVVLMPTPQSAGFPETS